MEKIKPVSIRVHPLFFEMFETKRKNYEKRLKVNISQIKTSELMQKEFTINTPRIKIRNKNKFMPKRIKKNRFFI